MSSVYNIQFNSSVKLLCQHQKVYIRTRDSTSDKEGFYRILKGHLTKNSWQF